MPDAIDKHIGRRLRQRRMLTGVSQQELGEAIGVSFQQIQKYERGANRINAGALWKFCKILDVAPAYFFMELKAETPDSQSNVCRFPVEPRRDVVEYLTRLSSATEEDLAFIYEYLSLNDEIRRRARAFIKAMTEGYGRPTGQPPES